MTKYFCDLLEVSHSGYYNYLQSSTGREARERLDLIFSRKKIQRIMRNFKIVCPLWKWIVSPKYVCTISSPNVLFYI